MKKTSIINKLIILAVSILFVVQIFFVVISLKEVLSKKESDSKDTIGIKVKIPEINPKTLEKIDKLKDYPFILELSDDWQHYNPLKSME